LKKVKKLPKNSAYQQTGELNYQAGVSYLDASISKDPNFWEAYLLKAEFLEYQRKYAEASLCYKKALEINPTQ